MKLINQLFKSPYFYLIIILLGTFFKIYFLESKYYWVDEIYTIQQTSGLTLDEFTEQFPENEIKNIQFYHDKLHLNSAGLKWKDQIRGIASAPNFTPAHYALLTIWQRVYGDDYIDYRVFSIFCYILTLVLVFLFCSTFFKSRVTAWLIISILAVSPYIHVFIQEARYYILWIGIVFLLNFIYLKLASKGNKKWFIWYTIVGIISLYVSTFSALLIIGHLVHLILFNKKSVKYFLLSLLLIGFCYLPWFYSIIANIDQIFNSLSWQLNWKESQAFWEPLAWQIFGFSHSFFNIESHIWGSQSVMGGEYDRELILTLVLGVLFTILIIFSFISLIKNHNKKSWLLILLLILPTLFFFYFMDICRNSFISPTWRYSFINMVLVIVVVGAFLAKSIMKEKMLYIFIYLGIIAICIYSLTVVSSNKCWYSFSEVCSMNLDEANKLDLAEKPLVITNFDHWMGSLGFLSMVVESNSTDIDILRVNSKTANLNELIDPKMYTNIYFYMASDELNDKIRSAFPETDIFTEPALSQREITIEVQTDEIHDSSSVYITGNHYKLGNWDPSQVELLNNDQNIWSKTLSFSEDTYLEFKFTLGSWEREALDENNEVFLNFNHTVNQDTILRFEVQNWKSK